ncbi:uncharacterized protein [Apostichopus japonicus]|uniref:uncharacterized protein n=1 Tax=Stichopus japonicus TaxID=307972 RepID=UPI003AB51139
MDSCLNNDKLFSSLLVDGKPVLDLAGAGVLYCSSCEVMCITREQLDEHNTGQKHLSVVEGEKQRQKEAQEATTGDLGYGCRICDVKLNSKQNYIEHKQSKKHLKKWRAKEEKKMEGKMPYGGFRPEQYPPFPPMPPFPPVPGPHHSPHRGGRGRGFDVMEHGGWESERPPFERAGPGRWEGRGRGRGRPWDNHQDFSGEGHRSDSETGSSQGFDFSKAVSSEGGLSEVILKYLPKEALVQLAMEALTSKSKELIGNASTGAGGSGWKGNEEGQSWDQDEDYRAYHSEWSEWNEGDGRERGFSDRGLGRGFDGGRGRGSDGGRGRGFDGGRGRGFDRGRGRGFDRGRGYDDGWSEGGWGSGSWEEDRGGFGGQARGRGSGRGWGGRRGGSFGGGY